MYKLGTCATGVTVLLIASVVFLGGGGGVEAEIPPTSSTAAEDGDSASIPTVELIASEHAFVVPSQTVGGVVRVQLDNRGQGVHMAQLVRIDDDRSASDVVDLLAAIEAGSDPGQPEWLHMTGINFSPVGPDREFTLVTHLEPGRYVAFCQLAAVNGSHATHGMVAELKVVGSSDAEFPETDATLVVDDGGFTLPVVGAGRQLVALRNDGNLPHQFEFGQLHDGSTFEDAVTFLQGGQVGELPAQWAGGIIDVPPGQTVIAEINLEGGDWSVIDVSDTGVMVGSLTVG